jgi:hypothetical protein
VDWQSADADAGVVQLVLQKARRSSQLRSGGVTLPESGAAVVAGGGGGTSVQVPRCTLCSLSTHASVSPATQLDSPQASVRRTPAFSTRQVQSSLERVQPASGMAKKRAHQRVTPKL